MKRIVPANPGMLSMMMLSRIDPKADRGDVVGGVAVVDGLMIVNQRVELRANVMTARVLKGLSRSSKMNSPMRS
jgi:hypothetical protein